MSVFLFSFLSISFSIFLMNLFFLDKNVVLIIDGNSEIGAHIGAISDI